MFRVRVLNVQCSMFDAVSIWPGIAIQRTPDLMIRFDNIISAFRLDIKINENDGY